MTVPVPVPVPVYNITLCLQRGVEREQAEQRHPGEPRRPAQLHRARRVQPGERGGAARADSLRGQQPAARPRQDRRGRPQAAGGPHRGPAAGVRQHEPRPADRPLLARPRVASQGREERVDQLDPAGEHGGARGAQVDPLPQGPLQQISHGQNHSPAQDWRQVRAHRGAGGGDCVRQQEVLQGRVGEGAQQAPAQVHERDK